MARISSGEAKRKNDMPRDKQLKKTQGTKKVRKATKKQRRRKPANPASLRGSKVKRLRSTS
jgi:hypothetical protein